MHTAGISNVKRASLVVGEVQFGPAIKGKFSDVVPCAMI